MYIITFHSLAMFACVGSTQQQLPAFRSLHWSKFSPFPSQHRCHICPVCIPHFPKCFPFLNFVPTFLSLYPNPAWCVFISCQVTPLKHQFGACFSLSATLSPLSHLGPAALLEATMYFNIHCLVFYPLLCS